MERCPERNFYQRDIGGYPLEKEPGLAAQDGLLFLYVV